MIKEQSCHHNTLAENNILFKKPLFNARYYSILFYYMSKNKQDQTLQLWRTDPPAVRVRN